MAKEDPNTGDDYKIYQARIKEIFISMEFHVGGERTKWSKLLEDTKNK